MTNWRFLAVLGLLACAAALGCRQTRTIFCEGQLESSIQLIDVPGSLQVLKPFVDHDKEGHLTHIQVQVRNDSTSDTYKDLEYTVQFFSAEGRELPSTAKGWIPLVIGRGELKSLDGTTPATNAVRATITIRQQNNNG
jgi:hypothetical protein